MFCSKGPHYFFVNFFCHSNTLFNASMGEKEFTSNNGLNSENSVICCAALGCFLKLGTT